MKKERFLVQHVVLSVISVLFNDKSSDVYSLEGTDPSLDCGSSSFLLPGIQKQVYYSSTFSVSHLRHKIKQMYLRRQHIEVTRASGLRSPPFVFGIT